MDIVNLIESNQTLKTLAKKIKAFSGFSQTGIINFVTNYEDVLLVNTFLEYVFSPEDVFKGCNRGFDAVELQMEQPGNNVAYNYIDQLIFGSFKVEKDDFGIQSFVKDPVTGERVRFKNGFLNNELSENGVNIGDYIVVRNLDLSLDFCPFEKEEKGMIRKQSLYLFEKIRNSESRNGKTIVLVTNEPLTFPFSITNIEFPLLDEYSSKQLLEQYFAFFEKQFPTLLSFTDDDKKQVSDKLIGLNFSNACEAISNSILNTYKNKSINPKTLIKNLRKSINRSYLSKDGTLTSLEPRDWNDYICPEQSNFTYDVEKILRDFEEIELLKKDEGQEILIESIMTRIPHVILLYGQGGVGKSSFPVHFAGLLNLDLWDFNVGACHSMWVGKGREQMEDALKKIEKTSNIVIRIDEYDRMMGSTSNASTGMHTAHKQVEGELMNWLQNISEDNLLIKNNIFIVMTTNHKENITGPLKRSGRIDLVIDISNFDQNSLLKTLKTAPQRIFNRGVKIIGVETKEKLEQRILELDANKISKLLHEKGFTVRDVDVLITEMSAHDYFYKKNKSKIKWDTESFIKVLEKSKGTIQSGTETNELILGDRFFNQNIEEFEGFAKEKKEKLNNIILEV